MAQILIYYFSRLLIKLTASPTVLIFSASSSGISVPNSSSNSITNSAISSESAPKSSLNDASAVTLSASTPKRSTMISFTLSKFYTSIHLLLRSKDRPFYFPILSYEIQVVFRNTMGKMTSLYVIYKGLILVHIHATIYMYRLSSNIFCFI